MKSLPLIVVLSLFATHAAATWEALPDSAIAGIRLMFNVLPAVFFLGGGLVMFFY
jgi:Na+/melibiose symporter-like transporter